MGWGFQKEASCWTFCYLAQHDPVVVPFTITDTCRFYQHVRRYAMILILVILVILESDPGRATTLQDLSVTFTLNRRRRTLPLRP